jgi:hypothetical protein
MRHPAENCKEEDTLKEINPIKMKEFQKVLKGIKNRKVTGPNCVKCELLKCGRISLCSKCVNTHRKCSEIPSVWYKAKVTPKLKRGRGNTCYNYCGIRHHNIGYKVYGRITKNRIQNTAETLLLEIRMDL